MSKYGLIGEKLGHSFSAIIHNKLFGYEYSLMEIPKDEIDAFMLARDFDAINVTIPYKQTVIPYLDEISDTAKAIGAVNTIVNKDGKLYGDNTDFSGMCALIEKNGIDIGGRKVAILGSGGTSKTANAVAKHFGAKGILRVSLFDEPHCITYPELNEKHSDVQIIINTTPCGMFPKIGESAVDVNSFPALEGVVDAVYNPLCSKLVVDARKKGIKAVGGLYMLVAQAAHAAERFVNKKVEKERIDDIFNELYFGKENIVLVGMPGSGKTTLGKILARKLGKDFVDTDCEIVKTDGRGIPEIFAKDGEAFFRKVESDVIKSVSARQGCVIATGGGAVLNPVNVDLLKENGRVVFVDRPLESILPTSDRPLSSDREALEKRYNERYGIYSSCCNIHAKCGDDIDQNISLILKEL